MDLKAIKRFLLLLCLFCFALNTELPAHSSITIPKNYENNYQVTLSGYGHDEYFRILFEPKDNDTNPFVYVSTSYNCQGNNLYVSTQLYDKIYIFIRNSQLSHSEFYICVRMRSDTHQSNYEIHVENANRARLPFNAQTSYYISDYKNRVMEFLFEKGPNSERESQISLFAKGKHVVGMQSSSSLTTKQFESGYVCYGQISGSSNIEAKVTSEDGDYVTVGSVTLDSTGEVIEKFKENHNEITIASNSREICLKIDFQHYINHITGKIYSSFTAKTLYKDIHKQEIQISGQPIEATIKDGLISDPNALKYMKDALESEGYFCIQFDSSDANIFSLQITHNTDHHLTNPPLMPGELRRHFMMEGEYAIFYGRKPANGAEEVNLNLKAISGFPELYIDECRTFPKCMYSEHDLLRLHNPIPSNRITVYSFYTKEHQEYKELSPISAFQPLMIVHCGGGGIKQVYGSSYCEFETAFFTDKETVEILEDNSFSQYLLANEEDHYKIPLSKEKSDFKSLKIEAMVFSGDIDLTVKQEGVDIFVHKYYLANKIVCELSSYQKKDLTFTVKAHSRSFYMVKYKTNDEISSIDSGINYVTHLDVSSSSTGEKKIHIPNLKYEYSTPYLLSFYSPNCQFQAFWENNKIESHYKNYAQKILNKDEKEFAKETYNLHYSIEQGEYSDYRGKFCMVYVTGLELSEKVEEYNHRAISLSEGVPHRHTFSKNNSFLFYTVHVADQSKTLALDFNLIDKAAFDITTKVNNRTETKKKIYRNSQIYISPAEFKKDCNEDEVCTVLITVELEDKSKVKKVELTPYVLNSTTPIYMEKNVIKEDVVYGNLHKHYYFDIQKGEYGDITLDFKRGSGHIYVSVVPRELKTPMTNSNWRGVYHFPETIQESLKYITYGKKIPILEENTKDCENGCYVLINIHSNMNLSHIENMDQVPFRLSIIPRVMKVETSKPLPKVKINVNEFIIGDIVFSSEHRKYDYYTVVLPYESEFVVFDFQADSPALVINVGEERPTIDNNPHFHSESLGRDYVYKLTREEIVTKAGKSKDTSLRGLTLTIGIYAETSDSIQFSPYAFKIFMPPTVNADEKLAAEIIHIRSDQKVQCRPVQQNDKDLCIFAVVFDDMDIKRNMIVYPKSQNGKPLTIYGEMVDSLPIETNAVHLVKGLVDQLIGNSGNKVDKHYIYKENIDKSKSYLFVTVQDHNSGDTIEVYSSTYSYTNDLRIYPNPSTPQIFAISNHDINLNFLTTQDLLLNIVSVSGTGHFFWKENKAKPRKYYLEGLNDRLSLTTFTNDNDKKLAPLAAESLVTTDIQKEGFIFYITYYPRSYIDQIREGRSTAIYYRTATMPIYYYSPISPYLSWSINLDFYDIGLPDDQHQFYEKNLFDIWATVMTEEETIKARFDPAFKKHYEEGKAVKGIFDSAFGTLFLSSDDINRLYNASTAKHDNPSIFLAIEKDNNFKSNFSYMGLEVSIYSDFKTGGNNSIPEGIYLNGKVSTKADRKLIYRLQLDKDKPYIRIEYSSNSDLVNFALTSNIHNEYNDYFENLKVIEVTGRKLITAKLSPEVLSKPLYFIVFKNGDNYDTRLDYFVFKYMTAKQESEFKDYLSSNQTQIHVTNVGGNSYEVSFLPIESDEVTYFIKAVYANNVVYGEKIDSIAISEAKGAVMQITNPDYKEGVHLKYRIDAKESVSYIKVMARVDHNSQKMFYLYKPYEVGQGPQPGASVIHVQKTDALTRIPYNYEYNKVTAIVQDANKIQKYQLKVERLFGLGATNVPDYIKVEAKTLKGKNSPILTFSAKDEEAKQLRLQLSRSNFISNSMWIKKEQFDQANFYVVAECPNEHECGYNLTFSGHSAVIFEGMQTYKYYVSQNNTQMIFRFKNEKKEVDQLVTFYATGGQNISMYLADCWEEHCEPFNFKEGSAITMKSKDFDYYVLTVNAKVGYYITVGAKVIDKNGFSPENILEPEYGQLSGFLRKKVLEKECYILPKEEKDTYYITGTLFSSWAEIAFLDEHEQLLHEGIQVTEQGFFQSIYNSENSKRRYICISFLQIESFPQESFSYSIQIQGKKNFGNNVYNPQYSGFIYPRISPTGSLTYFNKLHAKEGSGFMVYNMLSTMGYPKMYIYSCETYPNCDLDYNTIDKHEKVERVPEINRMSSYDFLIDYTGSSPIDAKQAILVVKCTKPNNVDYDHCQYLTSIFGDQEEVLLIDSQPFGQYIMANTTDYFLIDASSEKLKPLKIQVDFLVVVGDVSFQLLNAETNTTLADAHKYYLANKIFYSITIDDSRNAGLKKIKCVIKSKQHSYYIVEYRIVRDKTGEETNYMYSSMNNLIPVFQNQENFGTKYIQINSVPIIMPKTYIATFHSLNCKIKIQKGLEKDVPETLPLHGNFAQDVHIYNPTSNLTNYNTYSIQVSDDEKFLISDKDICMVYVSGLEYYDEASGIRKEILVSEGVPQKVLFEEGIKNVRYIYPHVNPTKNLTVSIHMIAGGVFRVKIFFRDTEYNHDIEYSQSTILYIQNEWVQAGCRQNELCTMTVELELLRPFSNGTYPYVETTIKQVKNEPYYLPRGIIKNEFIAGNNYLYLYTDVGKQEGYITINFRRNSGFIFSRIVQIEQQETDQGADWRKYRFPKNKNEHDSLYYDFYNKKILYTHANTEKCEHGCYILISIKTSVFKDYTDDHEFQYFTLLADFSPATYKAKRDLPKKIEIDPEEYIIGSLYKKDDPNHEGIYEYYYISCPIDAEAIEIDWQSDIAELLVKVGEGRPTLTDRDFHFSERRDTNILLSKKDIFRDHTGDLPSLIYQDLSFGVYTKTYDTNGTAVYSFRIHFTRPKLNIHRINSDQKTICNPSEEGNNEYRCLFMIVYEEHEYFNDLIIYAKSQSPSAVVNMYADYVENEIYNSYNVEQLRAKIPKENAFYSTKRDKNKFIFLEYGNFKSNCFLSVVSDSKDPIELYTSFKTFEDRLSPNPSSAQVYSLDISKKSITLDFITSKSITIKVSSLHGEASIHEEKDVNDKYYLRGAEDNFDLVLPAKMADHNMLIVENLRYGEKYKNPGFAFIVEFQLRAGFNLDEIAMDDTSEMIYKQADFPVYYYSKIFNRDKDINAFFYLHNYEYKDSSQLSRQISSNDLVIRGKIYGENEIYEMKEVQNRQPSVESLPIIGTYDPTIQTGNLLVKKEEFSKEKFTKPTLLFVIAKGSSHIEYKKVRGEVGLSTINGGAPMIQKLYQFGKIENSGEIYCYKLAADFNNTKYMRIQFSANSRYVNFAISSKPNVKTNDSLPELTGKRLNGLRIVTFKKPANAYYLYMNVFLTEDSKDKRLNNFVFKYINAFEVSGFQEYKVVNNDHKVKIQKESGKTYKVTFNPLEFATTNSAIDTTITYTVKILPKDNEIANENINMIAMSESNIIAKRVKGSTSDRNPITVELTDVPDNFKSVQVVSTIIQGSIIEYVAYQAVDSKGNEIKDNEPTGEEPSPSNTDSSDSKGSNDSSKGSLYVIIGVSTFLVVVVIVLIVVVIMYNSKNKDLLTQVNKISFVESGAAAKEDSNLLMDNKNELD